MIPTPFRPRLSSRLASHLAAPLPLPVAAAALLAVLSPAQTFAAGEFAWKDLDPTAQISPWEEPANWGGVPAPNAPGARVRIATPKISKYVQLHQPATVGGIYFSGQGALPSGILAAEGSGAVLRFDNGDAPAVLSCLRESRDTIDIPIEFARDLVVTNGYAHRDQGSVSSVFFDANASFTPLCVDGKASLAFHVLSRISPGGRGERDILDRKMHNIVRGFIEDSLDGAPLSVTKSGRGALAFACCDNAYSGGTTLEDGALYGVNGDNMDAPFLPFGTGQAIAVGDSPSAALCLLSAKPGIWGPGHGYDIACAGNARLTLRGPFDWNRQAPEKGASRLQQIGSLSVGGTNAVLTLDTGLKLRVDGPVSFATSAVLRVERLQDSNRLVPDADFAAGIRQTGPAPVALVKNGYGHLRIGADSDFAGGIHVVSGAVAVASSRALGTGPARFEPSTSLIIEAPDFHPAGGIALPPGSHEIWRNPLARLGADPEAKAGCRIGPGVDFGIAADMRHLKNKTVVLSGGRLFAYRDHAGSETNAYVVGPGVAFYTTATNLVVGNPWYPRESPFLWQDRTRWPLSILGPIHEHQVSATLVKTGTDRVEIGGFCDYTGGTDIRNGTLAVLPSGRLGSGPVTATADPKSHQETTLRLAGTETLAPGTVLHLNGSARLILDFNGEISVQGLVIDGKPQAPGVWGTSRQNGVTRIEIKRIGGSGRLRILE